MRVNVIPFNNTYCITDSIIVLTGFCAFLITRLCHIVFCNFGSGDTEMNNTNCFNPLVTMLFVLEDLQLAVCNKDLLLFWNDLF